MNNTEKHFNAIRTYCREHNLPTSGTKGVEAIRKVNEQMKSRNPSGYEGVKQLINKSLEYISITRP